MRQTLPITVIAALLAATVTATVVDVVAAGVKTVAAAEALLARQLPASGIKLAVPSSLSNFPTKDCRSNDLSIAT